MLKSWLSGNCDPEYIQEQDQSRQPIRREDRSPLKQEPYFCRAIGSSGPKNKFQLSLACPATKLEHLKYDSDNCLKETIGYNLGMEKKL